MTKALDYMLVFGYWGALSALVTWTIMRVGGCG